MSRPDDPRPLVLLASPYGAPGGGMGRIADTLADEAVRRDLPVRIERLETRGASLWRTPWVMTRAIARLVVAHRIEPALLLHLHVAERGSVLRKGLLLLLARALRRPVLLHLHAAQIVTFYRRLPRPLARLLGWTFRQATLCVVLGEAMRGWMVDQVGVPSARVVMLRNGVPVLPVPPARPRSAFRLLFLGNLSDRKGVPELIEAVASLPFRIELVLAGGGEVERFRKLAAAHGLQPRFTGWLGAAAAAAELASADVLVLPSHNEGLPLVILEALARRVAVIATPVGAIPEVLQHGRTALLVPPGDAGRLAAAVAELAADPPLRARLAAAGQALYERDFTAAAYADRMIALYRNRCGLPIHLGALQIRPHAPITAP